MRTTYDSATVRLYHLDDASEGGAATTLCYAPLTEACGWLQSNPKTFRPHCSSLPTMMWLPIST